MLKYDLEKFIEQKENIQLSVDTVEYSSKGVQKIIEAQIVNKEKFGQGYSVVPPPLRGMHEPPGLDLAHTGLDEFKDPNFPNYGPKVSEKTSESQANEVVKNAEDTSFKEFVPTIKLEFKVDVKTVLKVVKQERVKPVRDILKYAEMYIP